MSGLPARKHLKILLIGSSTGGTYSVGLRFNNDSGNNYSWRVIYYDSSANGAAVGSSDKIQASTTLISGASLLVSAEVSNRAAANKILVGPGQGEIGGTSAGFAPSLELYTAKWANTSNQITRVDVIRNAGTGSLAAGSQLVVLGHD